MRTSDDGEDGKGDVMKQRHVELPPEEIRSTRPAHLNRPPEGSHLSHPAIEIGSAVDREPRSECSTRHVTANERAAEVARKVPLIRVRTLQHLPKTYSNRQMRPWGGGGVG